MEADREVLAAVCPNRMGRRGRRAAHKVMGPRSSSPLPVCLGLPRVLKQAFSTIAWDDLECSGGRESPSFGAEVNGRGEDEDFGDYGLDFIADSPSTLESSLSPDELVPFRGCVIPPLTPRWDSSADDGSPGWDADGHGGPEVPAEAPQDGADAPDDRNVHLRQLARRAKHLASVLEELVTGTAKEQALHPRPSPSPCKRRRRPDEGYETEASDSVEDMLRDISTRCNAVLHTSAAERRRGSEAVRAHGAFSGLQTSFNAAAGGGAEDDGWSFRTSVREHGTVRTRAFPHGHAFTSRTQDGGHRFRWVPNHS